MAEQIARAPLRKQLAVALDDWALVKNRLRSRAEARLLAVASLADEDPRRQQLRDPSVRKDIAHLQRLADEREVLTQPPANLCLLSSLLNQAEAPGTAEWLLRQAQQQYPTDFWITFELGAHLDEQPSSNKEEAIGCYRAALALQPQSAAVYNNLGILLAGQMRPAEAEAAYRKTLELLPDYAGAHCNLGFVLRDQARLAEAVASLKKGHDLGSRNPGWPHPSAEWVRQAERLAELDARLPAVLKGETKSEADEQIQLALLCQRYKQLHTAAACFYREAFAAQPKLADDLRSGDRYNAASAAALAGCGQGKDADQTDEKERARLRAQALTWLRADLAARSAQLKDNPEKAAAVVQQTMQQWQQDANLAGVREADALAKLPDDECKQWRQLWDDVEALRWRAAAPK